MLTLFTESNVLLRTVQWSLLTICVTVLLSSGTSGRTSNALNFSHQLNPNLVIFLVTQKVARELKVLLF